MTAHPGHPDDCPVCGRNPVIRTLEIEYEDGSNERWTTSMRIGAAFEYIDAGSKPWRSVTVERVS